MGFITHPVQIQGSVQCKNCKGGTSLAVQWLRLRASTAGVVGSIPGWGTKIPRAALCCQKQTNKKEKKKSPKLGEVTLDFPGGAVVKNPPANAGDTGLSPGPGRSHMPRSN